MLESHGASFVMPDGLTDLMSELEETWPAHLAEIRASGVPTNETPEAPEDPEAGDPLAAGAAAGAATAAAADPEAGAPAEPEPAVTQPQYDPLEVEALRERMAAYEQERGELLAALQGRDTGAPATGELADADLYDEYGNLRVDVLRAEMARAAAEANRPLLDAIAQARQQEQVAATQEHYGALVEDMIADNVARHGDLSEAAIQMLDARAMQILPELNQRYGTNPDGTARNSVVERAIEQAASEVRELLGDHGNSQLEQERHRLATLAGTQGEPGPGGGGAHEAPVVRINERVVDRYAAAGQ